MPGIYREIHDTSIGLTAIYYKWHLPNRDYVYSFDHSNLKYSLHSKSHLNTTIYIHNKVNRRADLVRRSSPLLSESKFSTWFKSARLRSLLRKATASEAHLRSLLRKASVVCAKAFATVRERRFIQ